MALELIPPLYLFEYSTKCTNMSFDPDSFLEQRKGLFNYCTRLMPKVRGTLCN